MAGDERPKVLCVDDEPHVLDGLALHLQRRYEVLTAEGGAAALDLLQRQPAIAVIVSDMRMPGMDGAQFLSRSRQVAPNSVRLLLTGHTDISAAIAAVNSGQVFRFLSKPCPPTTLITTVEAAVEQHRLITAEKVLLEQTLHGCIKALTDVLALADPVSFGRAQRIKQLAMELAEHAGISDRWQLEMAAIFSQIGLITIPPDTAEKLQDGRALTDQEHDMVARMPIVTEQLLANIPRLEIIRDILKEAQRSFRPVEPGMEPREALVRRCGHVLKIAAEFDTLDGRGMGAAAAIGTMRARPGVYDAALLNMLESVRSSIGERVVIREIKIAALRPGMIFAEDVRLVGGALLVARGYEVTERFVERVRNFAAGSVQEPVCVQLPRAPKPAPAGV